MKTTAVYARYSSDNQRAESIDEQVRACRYYAQQTGQYDIIAVYKDEALSGYKNIHKRDGFAQLMQDARAHKFDCVMVYELSRFARNGSDTIVNTDELSRLGIEFVSVRERLDRTPEGRMMLYVITGMNEYYSANLAIEVMRGLKENAYNAKHTGGVPPLGYDVDKQGRYVINPLEAAAVRLIYDMYLAGSGYTVIIDELNSRGYRTKRGSHFGKNSLYDLLRNEKYTGTFVYNKTAAEKSGRQNRHAYKPESDIIKVQDAFPAIISPDEYKEVLQRMEQNRHKGAANKAHRDYMLSGKLYCGHCGRAMCGDTRVRRGHEYYYYTCGNYRTHICPKKSIKAEEIEAKVIGQLNSRYFATDVIERIAERIHEENAHGVNEVQINMLRKQSAALGSKVANGTKAILDGVDSDELRAAVGECSKQKKAIDSRIAELEAAGDNDGRTVEEIKSAFEKFADLNNLPYEQKKRIIQQFVWRVYVYNNDDNPDDDYKIKIVLAPTEAARGALNSMASDYVALTDYLSDMSGSALPLPKKGQATCI